MSDRDHPDVAPSSGSQAGGSDPQCCRAGGPVAIEIEGPADAVRTFFKGDPRPVEGEIVYDLSARKLWHLSPDVRRHRRHRCPLCGNWKTAPAPRCRECGDARLERAKAYKARLVATMAGYLERGERPT